MRVLGHGPKDAKIIIVGEAPGHTEEQTGFPFVGQSGGELTRMLGEAGIDRSQCYITNTIKTRPYQNDIEQFITKKKTIGKANKWVEYYDRWVSPVALADLQELRQEISHIRPNIIIALGDTAMWALTGRSGIASWRGSMLAAQVDGRDPIKLIPTYHPAAIMRQWEWRYITVHDLRRASRQSTDSKTIVRIRVYTVNPTYDEVLKTLDSLLQKAQSITEFIIAIDIETINHNISCVGIAWSEHSAICIPFYTSRHYYTEEQEVEIISRLKVLFEHPSVICVLQNGLYDIQYFAYFWGIRPRYVLDTMILHHIAFAGLPKSLDFLASMYCENYVYWKDELKDYRQAPTDDLQFFRYNCDDCTYTYEILDCVQQCLGKLVPGDVVNFQMIHLYSAVLDMMLRGVRIDKKKREQFASLLWEKMAERQQFLDDILGYHLNIRSPKQVQKFFYDEMKIKPIKSRITGNATTNDDALKRIGQRDILLRPIVQAIADLRTLNVYYSTFVQAQLDPDGRMRCSYNPAGTTTFRFSSSENAFGRGMNLQNVPPEDKDRKAKEKRGDFVMPNIRELFIPDPGHVITDWDLDRADLQVVVWEADDADLKAALRLGVDMHCMNAADLYGISGIPVDELIETHPNYPDHRARIGKTNRDRAKAGVHAVNYYCQGYTLATALGTTVREAEAFIAGWLNRHPGIRAWHDRTAQQLSEQRFVTNKFGYRRFFFDRIDSVLPEALAWIPQSTVACVINRGLVNLNTNMKYAVQILMQVHDSLVVQLPNHHLHSNLSNVKANLTITIPYEDPLIIPVGCKASAISWGHCSREEYLKLIGGCN